MLQLFIAELFLEKGKEHDVKDTQAACVQYIRSYEHTPKRKGYVIFDDGMGESLTAAKACYILDYKCLTGDVLLLYFTYFIL